MAEACKEEEKDKFKKKRKTQTRDERGKVGSRTYRESAHTSDHSVTMASSGDTASQSYWRGNGRLSRYQTGSLFPFSSSICVQEWIDFFFLTDLTSRKNYCFGHSESMQSMNSALLPESKPSKYDNPIITCTEKTSRDMTGE